MPDEQTKIRGPHYCGTRRRKKRYRVWIEIWRGNECTRSVEYFARKTQAEARIEKLKVHDPTRRKTIGNLLKDYERYLTKVKQLKPRSVATAIAKICYIIDDKSPSMTRVTSALVEDRVNARLLEVRAVNTVAGELGNTKTFLASACKKSHLDRRVIQELKEVHVEGRRKRGKAQLTVDESGKFLDTALAMLDKRPLHDGPLIAVLPLLYGVSGREILDHLVRDVDANR